MNIGNRNQIVSALALTFALAVAALALVPTAPAQSAGRNNNPGVLPINSTPYGKTYGQWSAEWWKWALALPLEGHPFIDDESFQCDAAQSGPVWFLGAPFGTVERTCSIPAGKAVFFALLNAEASNLEDLGETEAEQRDNAEFLADHIGNLFCTIDGVAVQNLNAYRFPSPQFEFTAPTPWIFGATGGPGTSVADGYFLFLAPPSRGGHTVHFGGTFHFSVAEGDPFDFDATLNMTYRLTVEQADLNGAAD